MVYYFNNRIKKYLMADFQTLRIGDDYSISTISHLHKGCHPIIMKRYHCIICHSGSSSGYVNLRPVTIKEAQIAINVPGQILQHTNASKDYTATVISLSHSFISSLGFPYNFQINKIISDNSILTLKESEFQAVQFYCAMASRTLAGERQYGMEIIRHLTCAFIYALAHCITSQPHKPPTVEETLMKNFMHELEANFKNCRKANEYAEKLNVSHPYLSSVVKKVSQRTVSEWIADYVILEAKALLHTTNMTIQQISNSLNFPNQSFFGKYFKSHTGLSPKAYRESLSK